MSLLFELKFDEMEVDTKLAQEYFMKKQTKFCDYGANIIEDENHMKLDPWGNKVYCTSRIPILPPPDTKIVDLHAMATLLWKLSKKIEQNGDLFCQLQHLLTKIPIDECRNYLQLLINSCLCWSSIFDKYTIGNNEKKVSTTGVGSWEKMELNVKSMLDFISAIDTLSCKGHIIMYSAPETAAISTLFTELCDEVGFKNRVSLFMCDVRGNVKNVQAKGCFGVVSDSADVDSAVQAFIESTTVSPWRLTKILVQENVYGDFQRSLQWKCRLNKESTDQYDANLKTYCTDVQVGGGKMFLLDYAGGSDFSSKLHTVTVEVYRTSKELLTITSKFTASFVSLWASESAQAKEIAFSLSTPIVWVNSFGVFSGPPQISDVFLNTENFNISSLYVPIVLSERLANLTVDWLKLDLKERQETIAAVVQKLLNDPCLQVKALAERLQTLLRTYKPGFVEVNKNYMWIGMDKPVGLVYVDRIEDTEFFVNAIVSAVHGNHVVLGPNFENISSLILPLEVAGVPICIAENECHSPSKYKLYDYKMICSNFGTIFAN